MSRAPKRGTQEYVRWLTEQYLLLDGTIELKDHVYIGHAADGVEVQLGCTGYEDSLERYLEANPTPECW